MNTAAAVLAHFRALPLATVSTVLQGRRPLILAPHPDDESLGCGGLIAAACAAGLPPEVVILTDGAASHPGSISHPPARLRALRTAEAKQAAAVLGLPPDRLTFLAHEDSRLPATGEPARAAVATLASIAAASGCGIIIAPWVADPHCDHEAAAQIADLLAAATHLPLLSYPVWGWLLDEAAPVAEPRRNGWRLDISAQLPAKRHAIAAHQSQYGGVITDAPDGFRLPASLLAVFDQPYEVFIAA